MPHSYQLSDDQVVAIIESLRYAEDNAVLGSEQLTLATARQVLLQQFDEHIDADEIDTDGTDEFQSRE